MPIEDKQPQLPKANVSSSGDLISRKELLQQIDKSREYYKKQGRFDYDAGLDKARYLIAMHNKDLKL